MQFPVTAIALLYCSFSLTVLAFCTIAIPVAVHIFGDLASFPIFGLRRAWLLPTVFLLNFGKPSFPIPILYFHCLIAFGDFLEFGLVA